MNKKMIRALFREAVFARDGHKCCFCDTTEDLDAHHIIDRSDMPAGGYVLENGITLCSIHHIEAELWHSSGYTDWFPGMCPEDLYEHIGSSVEKALEASRRLLNRR